jgi:hypothetical protein
MNEDTVESDIPPEEIYISDSALCCVPLNAPNSPFRVPYTKLTFKRLWNAFVLGSKKIVGIPQR